MHRWRNGTGADHMIFKTWNLVAMNGERAKCAGDRDVDRSARAVSPETAVSGTVIVWLILARLVGRPATRTRCCNCR